jgi:uncharacterized protein with ParB-like and HNH nuclease domain
MPTEPDDLLIEDSDEENDTAVTVNYDIATYPSDFTLAGIAKMWDDGDIKIPDFQREFVWTIRQSSLLPARWAVHFRFPSYSRGW